MKIRITLAALALYSCGGKNIVTPSTSTVGYYISFSLNGNAVEIDSTVYALYSAANTGGTTTYSLNIVGASAQTPQKSVALVIQGPQNIAATTYNLANASNYNPMETMVLGFAYSQKATGDTTGYTNVGNSTGVVQITNMDTTNKVVEGIFTASNLYGLESTTPTRILTGNITSGKFKCKLIK